MRVEEGDVLAYQHDSATWPGVLCQNNSTSRWRQTMFSWKSVGWAVVGDVISVPTTLSAQDNLVCYLRARFSPPFTVHVPQSMSYLRRPGAYRYSVEITGDVTARSVNCQVTAEDPVSGLTLIQPSIVGPGVSPGSVGTVPVEWRVETDIVIKVSHGSHLSAYWSHIGLSFPFTDSCPLRLTSLAACFSNSSSAEKPFSSIKLKLDTNSPVSSLTVSVSNNISSEQLTVDLSKAFRIRGLRVSLHQTQVHVLSDDGDIVVPASEKVRFRATLIQGSSVKYRWKVNGNIQHTSSQSNRFTHIFTTTGGQIVQVDASNVLSKEMNQLHIITVQPAKFHDARFSKFADFIEKSTQAEMTVVVDVRVGANVTVVKKVGDGVALTESLITNDTSLVQHFSQFYTTPGVFEVTVTFSDIFQSVSTSRNLTIINPMSGVLVSAKEDILPVSLNAQLQLVVPGQNLGYITHTWTFGDGISMNSSGTNALIRHKFSSAGSYTVRVVVSNGVRSVLESLNITVEEAIIGLSLSYDGPKSSQSVVYFTLEMQSGSDVRFSINTGDGTVYNLTMLTFNHQFSGPGVYNVTVSAWNQVSSASTALLVYAMGADMLEVVSVQTPGCTALGSSVNLTAEVINTVPVPLFYTWIFGDQTTQLTQDKDTVTHLYGTPGVFTVQVYVNNTVKTKSASAEVCIQEEITALSLSRLSPLALRHDGQVTGRVSASVGTGSNITYSWQATTDPSGSIVGVPCNQCEDVYSFTFDLPGEYEILVTASNNISSLTAKTRVRVQEIIEGVLLSCQNCKDIVYLGSTGSATQVELIASILHGTSVEYSWTVDSGSPVISVGNQYTAVLSDVRSYTAAVVVSNDVSTLNDSIIVQVQEAVTGLHIDVSTTEVVVGQPITFHALYSTGSDLTFSWFLCQDCFNATSTSQAYTHQFTQSGIYDVSLVAWNGVNEALASLRVYCIDTISDVVMESDLTGPFVPTGELVEFSASVKEQVKVNITWDIELHNFPILTQAGWNCSYDFPVAGIYTIFLTATNPLSSGGTCLTLTAQEKIHDFKIDVLNPILSTDEEVNITVTKSAGTDILYKWSVMNGSGEWNLQSSSGFIVIQLSAPGPQQLRCEAVNNVSRAVDYVDVTVQVPISEVVIDNPDQQVIQSESQLFFQATIGRGSHLSYQWFLNDTSRELSQASHFTHMFQTAGTFRLILRVHNGISDISVSKTIIVQDAVKDLVILTSANIAETGQAVHFNASMSAGSSVNFVWTFGDRGSPLTSAGHTVTHRYTFPDVYTIHLTASNNVSSETNILTLPVQDRVEKLYMTNCCGRVVPALSDLNFTAAVMKGTNVTYTIKVLDWTSSTICQSESKQLSCVFPRSGVFTLKVSAHNNVSDDKRLYVVNVETPLENIDVQPDGPGWDFLFQNQPITFKVIGQGVGESHSFEWQVNDSSLFTIEPKLNYVFSNQGVFRLKVKVWNSISSAIFNTTSIIHKFMCEMPIVDRVGQPNRISTPSRAVEFEAVVDSRGCLYYAAVHQWQVYTGLCQGTPSSQAYLPSSVYTRGLLLRIPRQVLSADIYCVQFTSGYKQTVVKQKLSYTLTLRPSPFVAIIKGGSEVVLPGSQPVTLDGSMSYDPDVQEGKRSHMMYTWNCSSVSLQTGTVEKNCFPQTRGKRIELDESLFLLDRVYTITLTVSLFNCVPGSDCRVAHAQQKIEISPDPVPTVSIDCLSCRATNSFQISPSQHVALRGQCTDCHRADNVQYLWTAMYGDNNQSVARKSLVLNSSTTTTGANVSDLVIRRGVLKDIHSYTFQLDVTKSVGSTHLRGEARLTLGPNHPPVGGTCSLYPAHPHIVPLESVVTVECQGWGDQDPGKSAILYRVSAERQLASGKMEQCVLYQGTMRNQSVYVSNWPDSVGGSPVTLRVDVQDEQGASTLGLKSQIWLLSPLLKPNESLSEHITTLALSHLRWLVKLHRPVALLQYSIAVLMELNRASMLALQTGSSDTDTQRRGEVREAITTALSHIPIETMQDIQQVAYALKQVSMYENEVQGESSHSMIHSLMKRVLDNVKAKVKQGLDCEDFAPGHLLLAVSNLVRAMNLHSTSSVPQGSAAAAPSINLKDFQLPWTDNDTSQGSDELQQADLVTDAVGFTEMIMSTVLQTQLQSEQLSALHMGDIHLLGQRTVPAAIWRERGTAGCQFLLPPSLLAHLPNNEEIFQIMFVMPDNPFPWGYLDNFTITSQVPSLTFQYSNGSLIPVRSLPEGEEIQVLMYGRGVAPEQDDKDTFTTMLDTNSQYLMNMTNITIEPGKATRVLLDTSSVSETTRSALHVQVRFSLLSDPGLHTNLSVSTTVFLGVGYEASEKRYEEKKVLTEDMMEDEQDHRQFTFFVGTSSFQPQSHYSLTVLNPSEDVSIEVYVHLYLSSCQYFDPVSQHWESKGCVVGDRSTPIVTVCMCNHLTSFGASALVPPNAIDFADLARLDVANNPVALITCSILLASYILLVIICRRQDLKDLKRISRVPLCGIDGAFKYEVTVVTGRQMSAGTTAHIGIKLYGEEGRSAVRHLCKQGAFQRNCQDTFLVAHDTNLGKLWKVVIWHDNAGLSPSWYLIQVVVRDLQTDHRYLFLGECWLSLQLHNGFIQKEMIDNQDIASKNTHIGKIKRAAMLPRLTNHGRDISITREGIYSTVTSPVYPHQQSKFSDLCWSAMSRGFSDQHLWVSLIDRPAQSRFTRTQRLTCCFTLLFTYLAVNIMWYGVIKTAPSPGARGTWNYLSWEEIVVGTVSSLLVFPVNILIAYIFRKTRSKENMFEYSQKPQTAQTVEMDADCGLSDQSSSLRRVSLRHELTQFYDRESSCDSLAMTTIKPLRRTNTLPKLPSEDSQDSLYNQGADSDSGVSSSRPKGQTSSMDSRKAWWSHDSIINHWPVMPEFKCGGEFTKRPAEASKAAVVEASLRISGIKVDDVDSDDGWSSCLDDLDTEDTVKDAKQKTAKFSQKQSDGEDWSLDDKEQWEKIEAEIFSEELPKKKKPVGEVKGKAQPQCGHKGSCKVEETSFISKKFTPRAEASLTTGSTCRRRSVGGSAGEATQHEPRKCSINSQRENSFDRMSVEANILFGRERDRTVSSIQARRGTLKDRKMSVASRLSYRLNRMLLPRWCVYVAYGMCVVISSVSVLLILLYANQLGSEGTWRWIISLVISFLLSAFFMEPLKVIFLAVFVAAVTKQIDEVEDDDAIEIRPMIETNERLKDVKFKPLGGYALLQAKEDARKISRMHLLMRQCLAYFCLLWIIVVISHGSYNNSMHQLSRQIRRTYTQTNFNGSQRFTTIDSITTFWQWSTEILASKIHQHGVSDPNLILGPVRLMQTRSIQTTCPAAGHWPGSILDSSGWGQCDEATESGEDTQSYGEGWRRTFLQVDGSVNVTDPQDTSTTFPWNPTNTTGLEDFSSHTAWTHRTAEDLQEGGVSGVISWYSGGGYSQILGSTETETQDILTYLQDTGWLTPRTRAIMVEWTMWNPSQDLTSVVLLTVEFPLTGKAITSVEMEINQLLRVGEGAVDPQLVCQIILLVVSVYFVVQCCLTVKTHGCQTFTRLGYVMEMLTTALILVSGGLYVTCVATTASTLSQHFNNTSRFTSFRRTAYLHWWSRQINAWLGFLILLKIVKQLRFSKSMSVFEKTLSAACWKLLGALVLFVLLLCTYAHVGYLLFGRSVFGYHSFAACLVSMVGMIRGSMDYTPLLHEQPVWTHLYLFSFGWCVFGLIFSLVLAVLRDTYKLTHSQMFYKLTLDIHDYEMIEFMLKRFKQWAGIIKPKAAFKKVKFAGLPSLSSHSTFSAPSNYSHSSSSSDSYGLEGGDGCLSVGQGLDIHLDQLPARWEDVLMKIRQLEEMDHHEEAMSQQIRTIITERRPSSSQGAKTNQPNPTGKPPKGLRARSMSDTKGLLHFSRRGSKSGRKSVSPPASNQQRSVAKRPHSDQSARVESNPDNLEHKKSSFISRIFKKAW
ncbi:LOW QUALITY PROTEIN: polycystin-1-like [Liolophura sinensis]|uniref:LOW QUALITY PROTEIN: polycystin-1-like n=1 Tax=Liolophura sinensis TaxID=3198878 RepID=UPI003159015E